MFPAEGPTSIAMARARARPVVQKATRWVKAHPLVSKAVPTAIGFAFGDLLTQAGQHRGKDKFTLDVRKTASMLAVGAAIAGPLGLGVLQLPGSSAGLIGLKVVMSEILGCIIWQAAYLRISSEYREGAIALLQNVQQSLDGHQVVVRRQLQRLQLAIA